MNDTPEPSKVTKAIVNKIHGGRKQDSKFWQSEFDYKDEEVEIEIRQPAHNRFFRNRFFLPSTTIAALIFLAYMAVYLKPDLFPFLDRHVIHEKLSLVFPHMLNQQPDRPSPMATIQENSVQAPITKSQYRSVQGQARSSPG